MQGSKGKKASQGSADVSVSPEALKCFRMEQGGAHMPAAPSLNSRLPGDEANEDEMSTLAAEIEFTTALINKFHEHTETWEAIEVCFIPFQ